MKRNTDKIKANAFKKSSVLLMLLIVFILPLILFLSLMTHASWASAVMLGVSLGLLAVYVVANISGMVYMSKHRFDLKKERENIFRQKEELYTGYDKLTRKVKRFSVLSYLYFFSYALIIICLNAGVLLLWAAVGFSSLAWDILLAVFVYILPILEMILLYAYFAFHVPQPGPYIFLGKEEYPELWGLAEKARQRCCIEQQYVLLAVPGSSAAISHVTGKLLQIVVGIDLLPLLKPEELYTVFVHEFSHASNRDTMRSFRINNRLMKWQLLSTKRKPFPCFLFLPLAMPMFKVFTTYIYLTSYNLELKADKTYLSENETVHLVNALAKIDLYEYNMFKLPPENLSAGEGLIRHKIRESFLRRYAENKDEWEDTCKRQLPARLDTHPNLAERMKNLGKDTFELDFSQNNEAYISEISKIDKIVDDVYQNSPDKDKDKKYGYDMFAERIEKAGADGARPGLAEGYAYFRMCDYEKAYGIYTEILCAQPDNPEALYYKSVIECDKGNEACVDGFIKLLGSINYFEASYITLARFLQYMALSETRDKWREHLYAKSDTYSDIMNINMKKCGKSTLPADKIAAVERAVRSAKPDDAYLFGWRHKSNDYNYLMLSIQIDNEKELDYCVKDIFFTVANECPALKVILVKDIDLPKRILSKMHRVQERVLGNDKDGRSGG